jgi:hypothetical protein
MRSLPAPAPDGSALVAAFSLLSRPGLHRHLAEYVLQTKGREFFLRTPAGYGVIVNPGYVTQLIIAPNALAGVNRNLDGQCGQVRQEPR